MLSLILGFLTAVAPLITSAGLGLINWFTADETAKTNAMQNFLNAIQAHLNDALTSVNTRISAAQQVTDLQNQDAAPPPATTTLPKS